MSMVPHYSSDDDNDDAATSADAFGISVIQAAKPIVPAMSSVAKIESSAPDVLAEVSLVVERYSYVHNELIQDSGSSQADFTNYTTVRYSNERQCTVRGHDFTHPGPPQSFRRS